MFVYGVASDRHCLTSTVSCLYHRLKKTSRFIGVAIFDDEEAIPRLAKIPLFDAVDEHFSSRSQPDEIKEFFLKNAG